VVVFKPYGKVGPPAKRMKYDASFKLKVARFAKAPNNSAAAREFGVNEKQVREWKKAEEKLIDITRTKCALRRVARTGGVIIRVGQREPREWIRHHREQHMYLRNEAGQVKSRHRRLDMKKARFTVVLSCMADGTKLKPMIIFKQKTMPKVKFPAGVYVHVHENGWMDEEGVRLWLEHIWSRSPGGLRKKRSLLVWDMFRSHLTEPPLDVCLNKPFKDRVRDRWNKWMIEGEKTFTKGGNMRAAPIELLCEIVIDSWNAIKTETVVKSFKKRCISNSLDGEEDDVVWEDDDEAAAESEDWDSPEGTISSEEDFEGF
ncbi:Pogo transposable element-like 10, partial [Homarus americanus]